MNSTDIYLLNKSLAEEKAVTFERRLLGEAGVAEVAGVRLLLRVNDGVGLEVGFAPEKNCPNFLTTLSNLCRVTTMLHVLDIKPW